MLRLFCLSVGLVVLTFSEMADAQMAMARHSRADRSAMREVAASEEQERAGLAAAHASVGQLRRDASALRHEGAAARRGIKRSVRTAGADYANAHAFFKAKLSKILAEKSKCTRWCVSSDSKNSFWQALKCILGSKIHPLCFKKIHEKMIAIDEGKLKQGNFYNEYSKLSSAEKGYIRNLLNHLLRKQGIQHRTWQEIIVMGSNTDEATKAIESQLHELNPDFVGYILEHKSGLTLGQIIHEKHGKSADGALFWSKDEGIAEGKVGDYVAINIFSASHPPAGTFEDYPVQHEAQGVQLVDRR